MQEFINGQLKILKKNTGDSSKILGSNIGSSSTTPQGEGRNKGKKNQNNRKRGDCLLHGPNTHDTNKCKTLGYQYERTKQTYAVQDKTQDQQMKRIKYGHSHSHTTYNYNEYKAEINSMFQQASKATIALFVKKAKSAQKRKIYSKMNNINK